MNYEELCTTMRLNLTVDEYNLLKSVFLDSIDGISTDKKYQDVSYAKLSLIDKLQNVKQIDIKNKIKSTKKANSVKIEKSKDSILNAIDTLKASDKKMSYTNISKTAKVSYNTIKSFLTIEDDKLIFSDKWYK